MRFVNMKKTYISPEVDTLFFGLDQIIALSADCVSPSLEEDTDFVG